MGGIARRLRMNLSLSWRWFNYWRKRYVWLRVPILLLVFAQPIYESRKPLIRELVVIAIKGIESSKRGPYFETRAIQYQEKKRLQRALLARFDANGDGRLNASEARSLKQQTGLSTEQVEGRALDVGLDPLVAASHTVGLLSRTQTANDLRREALATALTDRQREHEALWREVDAYLAIPRPSLRDFLHWPTWKERIGLFEGYLFYPAIQVAPVIFKIPRLSLVALGISVLMAIMATRRYGKGKALERRFLEEPSLAAAACPVCGEATEDFGALAQHRGSRAWTGGAIAFLVALALITSLQGFKWNPAPFPAESAWLTSQAWYALLVGVFVGIARYFLWPREVHLAHRKPWVRVAGFAACAVLVVGLLLSIGLASVRTWAPRARVVMVGSRKEGAHSRRRREAGRARVTSRESPAPAAIPSPTRTPRAWRDGRIPETRPELGRRRQRRDETRGERHGRRGRARSSRATRD